MLGRPQLPEIVLPRVGTCRVATINTLTNLSGRHPLERWGMSALTATVATLAAYVAVAAP